ncbi:MAG: guanylate kinase [Candidatus Magasanikbacteria bacterium RIFCSPHIGHO2_01_FULL_47_8]|uniref:Guanylate kinase n=1 Tax=Candidatus Magasanikbacteria bacterium RIFCSPHIGHO2_01_FULL_47_8 TaxID=1798673 RepID=A0A1F6MFC7_9BACT|nr:MAG: guanylate kinase [Candidatus Magasanikbacteria bacterium RIFCSPHIGHO2_01_FULL_47_8]
MSKGQLVIISSPSGGGKDSVINALLKIFPTAARLITTTTRPPRPGNVNGVDYYFISEEEFKNKVKNGDFLEHNFYAGNYYGAQKKHLEESLANHDIVFTQIEVNGKHGLDRNGVKNLSIFLLPENLEILRQRIERRGGITAEVIAKRLAIAEEEITASTDYDYRIVNEDGKMEETVDNIAKIIKTSLPTVPTIDKKAIIS